MQITWPPLFGAKRPVHQQHAVILHLNSVRIGPLPPILARQLYYIDKRKRNFAPMIGFERTRLHPVSSWLVTSFALFVGDKVLDGVILSGLLSALAAAAVLGIVNQFIRPTLFVLTLPITFLTLGLFTFVINALMLSLAAWAVPGFSIVTLRAGLGLAVIVGIVHGLVAVVFGEDR